MGSILDQLAHGERARPPRRYCPCATESCRWRARGPKAGIEAAVAWRTLSSSTHHAIAQLTRAEEAGKLEGGSRGPAQAHASRAHRTDSPSGPRARVRCRFGPGCACVFSHRHSVVLCAVRRCVLRAAIAAAIVRSVSVSARPVQHQRLPAGLLEDRHGGGLRECGRRQTDRRHEAFCLREYGDEPFLAERLLHVHGQLWY
jgi:hypothetical protein